MFCYCVKSLKTIDETDTSCLASNDSELARNVQTHLLVYCYTYNYFEISI